MSTAVMAKVWPLQMPGVPKAVLVSLADNANDHGVCWPSISTICTRTCFQRTAVMEAVGWLEEHGYLQAEKRAGRNTRYYITVPSADLFHGEQPVRQPNRSAKRTSPPAGPDPSATRTGPVRQTDTNHQEPSVTVNSLSPRAEASEPVDGTLTPTDAPEPIVPTPAALACMAMRKAGLVHVNPSHPKLLAALAAGVSADELADVVRECIARGGAPPGLAYVCVTAINRRREAAALENANQTETSRRSRPAGGQSLADAAAERARELYGDDDGPAVGVPDG